MSKAKAVDNTNPTDSDYDAVVAERHVEETAEPISNPTIDRRQVYIINRRRIIDTALDEGERLNGLGCIRRGNTASHFIFTGKNAVSYTHLRAHETPEH